MNLFKRLCLCFLSFLFIGPVFAQTVKQEANTGRQLIGLNDLWSFSKDEIHWEQVNLPHTWNSKDVMDDAPGYYRGTGWYKRYLKTSPLMKGKEAFLIFDGINQEAEVYVNGKLAGKHIGGYTRFIVPIGMLLTAKSGSDNEIKIRVSNRHQEDIPPLTADFTFFGGIYRKLNLLLTDPVHFYNGDHGADGLYIHTPEVSAKRAKVVVKAEVINKYKESKKLQLLTKVYDPEGHFLTSLTSTLTLNSGERKIISQDLPSVINPRLWSPKSPDLYRVVSTLIDVRTKAPVDELSHSMGFRWFKFDAEKGFFLNGQALKLMGASRHQDYEGLGNAVPDDLQIRDVNLLKAMGGNFLRVAHYPQDPVILEACDRLGILASVEIPVINEITESAAFTENCKMMQLEMIRQNFNHPSVVMWAYMNEVLLRPKYVHDKPKQELYFRHVLDLANILETLTRKEDSSRYTMMALHGDFERYHRVGLTKVPMVIGWNLYQGWYGSNLKGFGQFLDRHRQDLPDKPLLVTEFGADADPRIRSFKPIRFDKSVEYALNFSQVYLIEMLSRQFVSGGMVWNLADFNSESRDETMPHINNKGLLTLGRQPKDTYYLYQAYLLDQPFLKIASREWTERSGIADSAGTACTQKLQAATNLESAELFLNGRSLGTRKSIDHLCEWLVPFADGLNALRVISTDRASVSDQAEINFTVLPNHISEEQNFKALNILLGSERYFIDQEHQRLWIPDQVYHSGSWGHLGGTVFKTGSSRISYGSDKNILGTALDPIYQTQQIGLDAYQLDVPNGTYTLDLYFSELTGGPTQPALVYNLENGSKQEAAVEQRIFHVNINGKRWLDQFNIAETYGYHTAVQQTTQVVVNEGKGITIQFIPVKGTAVLNALSIRKLN